MKYLFVIIVSIFLFGCESFIMENIFELNEISEVDNNKIDSLYSNIDFKTIKVIKRMSIDYYFDSIITNNTIDSIQKKDLLQPIQIWYLDSQNDIIFRRITCNLPDILSKNWNYDNAFDDFPPINNNYTQDLKQVIEPYFTNTNKYKVIIFWSMIFDGRSKDIIEFAVDNVKNMDVEIILVNLDKEFVNLEY